LFGAASVVVGLLLGCLVYFFIEKPVNQFLLYRRVRRPVVVNV
jgi:peptidoglycan/LPS O-acetylase OafA/YrhL